MKATDKIWYAVVKGTEDNDWGYGSYDRAEALRMARALRDAGDAGAYVVVIEDGSDPVAVDEIHDLED